MSYTDTDACRAYQREYMRRWRAAQKQYRLQIEVTARNPESAVLKLVRHIDGRVPVAIDVTAVA